MIKDLFALLVGKNYVTSKRTNTLTIIPLELSNFISFKDQVFIYDGTPKTALLSGILPESLSVLYENNIHTEIGTYEMKVTIEGNANYAPIPLILKANLVIRNDHEKSDILQLTINNQIYYNPDPRITYILPCQTNIADLKIDILSDGAFIANKINNQMYLRLVSY